MEAGDGEVPALLSAAEFPSGYFTPGSSNIQVDGNLFRVFDPRIVNLYCVDGFQFSASNRIVRTSDYPATFDPKLHFVFDQCDHIEIPRQIEMAEQR